LMAVSSAVRTSFRISMIFASPCMGESVSRHRGGGGRLGGRCAGRAARALGRGDGEHRAKRVVAGAALIADPAPLQIAQGARAVVDGVQDSRFGGAAADADDHGFGLSLFDLL
jgi:hypothetical protein